MYRDLKVRVKRWEDWTLVAVVDEVARVYETEVGERLREMVPMLDEEAVREAFLIKVGQKEGVPFFSLFARDLGRYAREGRVPYGLMKGARSFEIR